jgi:hypothetical protein
MNNTHIHCRASESTKTRLDSLVGALGTSQADVITKLILVGEKIALFKKGKFSADALLLAVDFQFDTELFNTLKGVL